MKQRQLIMVFLMILCVLFSGCAKADETVHTLGEQEILLYYPDRDRTRLVPEVYTLQADKGDTVAVMEEVLLSLQSADMRQDIAAPVTEDVLLREYRLEDDLLTLDFDVRYLDMEPATEVLNRAAIVLSLTGIEGVDSVLFLVSGTSLMKEDDTPVGVMRADTFLTSVLP